MGQFFGTDGIRGPVGGPLVNRAFFEQVGRAVAGWASADAGSPLRRVIVARDPRPSGQELVSAVARGLDRGCSFLDAGILPTPALARAVLTRKADLGVMVTASHNPAGDNGVKFFTREGRKFNVSAEEAVEALIAGDPANLRMAPPASPVMEPVDAVGEYLEALESSGAGIDLSGWKIVVDTANGATRQTSPELFRRLGAEIVQLGGSTDGALINAGCGSEHAEALAAAVLNHGACLGIAHDGNGDRLVCVDENGCQLNGDRLLAILALDGLRRGWLGGGRLVATLQSNLGLDRAVAAAGGTVIRVPVGDRWVSEKMAETGAAFGGENSGHLIFSEYGWSGDGLLAALQLCGVMARTGVALSVLAGSIALYPQRTYTVSVQEKRPLGECRLLTAARERWEARLGTAGRILVRYSGTEPLLRILTEAENGREAEAAGAELVTAAQKELGRAG